METMHTLEARIPNIAGTVPEALDALLALAKAASRGGVPRTTHRLVDLRASQIGGVGVSVERRATWNRLNAITRQPAGAWGAEA